MGKKITVDTRYSEIEVGDELPNGDIVMVAAKSRSQLIPGADLVAITTRRADDSGKPIRFGKEWGDETYGAALERAKQMHSLPDHS